MGTSSPEVVSLLDFRTAKGLIEYFVVMRV
jgi:hypothetical protein